MKAAIYCRVSTDNQEAEGTSLQTQLEACLTYCQGKGYEVAYRFSEAYSGLTLDRPKLNELRELVRNDNIDVLVVYCLDRLSRDPTHGVIITQELEKHNVALESVTEDVDNSELGKLISYIRGYASKVETEKIRERTIRCRMQRAKEGRQPGGRALYGYDLVEGRHVVNEEEAKVVQIVFRYLANDGMTLRSIQKRLNGMGVLTRKGTAFWQRSVLHRLVREQAYTGEWHYNKTTQRPPKADINSLSEKVKPKDKWVPVSIPAIISRETFDAAQRQLARNAELCNRNVRRQYLLSGLIRCGKCGYSYNARTLRDTIYYTCNSKLGHVNAVSCESHGVRGDIIEPVVWNCVKELLSQPKLIIEQMEKRDLEMEGSGCLLYTSPSPRD